MRLLVLAALALLVYRMLVGRWPWQKRLSRKARQLQDARRVLGVAPDAARTEIVAAHRRKMTAAHPDRGGSGAGIHQANEARDLLLAELPKPRINEPKEPS